MLLGNGKGDSQRGNVEWFQCLLDMDTFLQIQFQSGVKGNTVWNDLRGPEQVDAMDVWILVSLQMWARGRKISQCCQNQLRPFRVPKGLEVFFRQWLTVAPRDLDVVSSVGRVVYCRWGCLVCKLIAVNVLKARDPVELKVDRVL